MAISFKEYHHLDTSVVVTAITTQSVDKAYQQMGFFEKIIDYFRGDVKFKAIETLVNEIKNVEPIGLAQKDSHAEKLTKFEKLSSLAKDEHRDKFSIDFSIDEDTHTWGYALKIEQTILYQASGMFITDNMDFLAYEAAYQDQEMINYFTKVLQSKGDDESVGRAVDLRKALLEVNNSYVNQLSGLDYSDINRAEKFKVMADLLPVTIPELRAELTIKKNVYRENTYEFTLGGKVFYGAPPLPNTHEAKEALISLWAAKIHFDMKNALYEANTKERFSESNMLNKVEEMADLPEEREIIRAALKDPAYSSDNFVGITTEEDEQKMSANFKENKKLVFAGPARDSSNKELRGEMLRDLLQTTRYDNLYELITSLYLTENDSDFYRVIDSSIETNLLEARKSLEEREMESLNQQIAPIEVGNTSIAMLLNIAIDVPSLDEGMSENMHKV
jgi:hypothetical protein